jgi:UDP-glucose 4-epimerase
LKTTLVFTTALNINKFGVNLKILIIGGSGFIGSALVKRLIKDGLDLSAYSRGLGLMAEYKNNWISGDILDEISLKKALVGVDLVIHCAHSSSNNPNHLNDFSGMHNIEGMMTLLKAMRHSRVKRLVFLSSGGTVYGNNEEFKVKESSRLEPISFYGVQKVTIENLLRVSKVDWGLNYIIIRPSNPFGEGQDGRGSQGLIGVILRNVIEKKLTTIFGDGEIIRDYIYINDFVDFVVKVLNFSDSGVYNCGSGVGLSVNEVISKVEDVVGKKIPLQHMPARQNDVGRIVLDCKKAKSAFNWNSTTSIEAGIKDHYVWMQDILSNH